MTKCLVIQPQCQRHNQTIEKRKHCQAKQTVAVEQSLNMQDTKARRFHLKQRKGHPNENSRKACATNF